MLKIASQNFDIVDFVLSGDLEKVAQIVSLASEEAQEAVIPDYDEQSLRPHKDFAVVLTHPVKGDIPKFAHYNKELTELNLYCLVHGKDTLPDEILKTAATNLTAAASKFGIKIPKELKKFASSSFVSPEVDLLKINQLSYIEKSAFNAEGSYALQAEKRYPINDKAQVMTACAYFEKYANDFNPIDAFEFAVNTSKAKKEFSLNVETPTLDKFASVDASLFNEDLHYHLESRKVLLTPEQDAFVEQYDNLQKTASEVSPSTLVLALSELDKKANLQRVWGKYVHNPLLSVCDNNLVKTAKVTDKALSSLKDEDLSKIVDTSTIKALRSKEGMDVYKSLPIPVRQAILDLVKK
jgi:hypothetical protein